MNETTALTEDNAIFARTAAGMRRKARGIFIRENTTLTTGTLTQLAVFLAVPVERSLSHIEELIGSTFGPLIS